MKKSRFSESQIVAILKEVELGAKVGETCRKHGISEPEPVRNFVCEAYHVQQEHVCQAKRS